MGTKIGSREYEASVNQELHRACEELAGIHAGDNRYMEWLREFSPEDHATLLAFPARIQALINMAPVKLLATLIDCQLALHRFWFECWAAREEIGMADLARMAGEKNWKM
jgi:hypothetical protein